MSTRTVFIPSHSSLDNIFAQNTTYVIPAYQRPYSWRALGKSDKTNQVNQMWDDLWSFFQENPDDKEYFLGSMVVIERKRRTFEVVDGQQRLTTLTLLYAAMRCFLRTVSNIDPQLEKFRQDAISRLEKVLFNTVGIGLVEELKVKLERPEGYDYNGVLSAAIECSSDFPDPDPRVREVVDRYFENRDFFIDRLNEKFKTGDRFGIADANRLQAFATFLDTRVSIVLITTSDFETAYFIFETLNNRGLPLTGRDLLRNFIIKELAAINDPNPAGRWTELEGEYPLTEDFIARWVESTKASQQRYSAFNDMIAIYNDGKSFMDLPNKRKVISFYEALENDLERYARIVDTTQVQSLVIRHKIDFIREAGNFRYGANLLLAAFRHFNYEGDENEQIAGFLTAYQRWLLHILLKPGVKFSSAEVYRAISAIKGGDLNKARDAFTLPTEDLLRLAEHVRGDILDHDTAKLLVATYVWHEHAQVGSDDLIGPRWELVYGSATLEHILPRKPAPSTHWMKDFTEQERRQLTYKMGNMTLLTGPKNSRAKNLGFDHKKRIYAQTSLPITRELAAQSALSPTYLQERHERMVSGVLKELGM